MAAVPDATAAGQHTTSDVVPATHLTTNTVQDLASQSSSVYDDSVNAPSSPSPPASQGQPPSPPPSIPLPQIPTAAPAATTAAPLSIDTVLQPPAAPALGPAAESPIVASGNEMHLTISLMLQSGARHPYRIDEKYLRSRNVKTATPDGRFEPRELSAYQLKELIWTDWRGEWEPRPASPSSIRLIMMGRMLEDKNTLKDYPFSLDQPNVVHMTVKPADLVDDDETGGKAGGKSGRARDAEDPGAGCRCVIL